jgi:putative hemolysin
MALLERVRRDSKIVANALLAGLPVLPDKLILVNAFESKGARRENLLPLRSACEWLGCGGVPAIFPGGEVASVNWMEHAVTDPAWKTTAACLARRAKCPVLPIFFVGRNSVSFHLAGALHPMLRTLSLAREFERLSGTTMRLRIGHPIPASALAAYPDPTDATVYLRARTFFLANRSEPLIPPTTPAVKPVRAVVPRDSERLLAEEVTALPAERRLAPTASSQCISRRRAQFHESWTRSAAAVRSPSARPAKAPEKPPIWTGSTAIISTCSCGALATRALPARIVWRSPLTCCRNSGSMASTPARCFATSPSSFERMGPAIELGRSFIMPQYQKHYAPLLLLWKGITRTVQRRPDAAVLFGAVSISNQYQPASRSLMVNYLSACASHELSRLVQPRKRFGDPSMRDHRLRRFASLAADIEDISLSIADIEHDCKGVRVLLRQYLKAGGKLLGFNLDPHF